MADYALISLTEALRELVMEDAEEKDIERVDDARQAASSEIEDFYGQALITRGTITEYHYVMPASYELFVRFTPIIEVSAVYEDSAHEYGSSTALVEGTDFIVEKESGRLTRVSSGYRTAWYSGWEDVQIQYTGGYADVAGVPTNIKKVCREYTALLYREMERREHGRVTINDAAGTVTRFGPMILTGPMKERLQRAHMKLSDEFSHTWTRWSVA